MSVLDSAPCANCHHGIRDHDIQGCKYGRATPEGCGCLFDYRDGDFNARALPVLCQAKYTIASGSAVPCARENGHPGEHEGYYPGDSHRSRWKDKPVIQAAADEPVANPNRTTARDEQVGGNHYRQFKIQPWDIWKEYGLDPWLAGVVKYTLRAGHKGSKLEDLKKARHYLDAAIEIEEGK